jgi:Zn-dependent metalloprotease
MRHGRPSVCSPVVCSIVPPHILRSIAERGNAVQRDLAHVALEISENLRGVRQALISLPAAPLGAAPGKKRRNVYDAGHTRNLPGKLVRGEGRPAVADVAANEAYDGSGRTYDFYQKVYQRNSIDDHGLRLDSSVHFAVGYNNAQWNGKQMVYGDGDGKIFDRFTKPLDVIGHELTHGITGCTAALDYHDQSGALNEHFSDVFGTLVKQYTLAQSADKADWLVASGVFAKGVNGVALRSMKAPGTAYDDKIIGKDPQPWHVKDYKKVATDSGGVHVNSGIPNHAFYQAATMIGGNAWDVAGRIWYVTLTRKLKHDTQFQQAADATYATAVELYGAKSAAAQAVAAGWNIVGIAVAGAPKLTVRPQPAAQEIDVPGAGAEVPVIGPKTRRALQTRR